MTIRTKEILKTYFETGDRPTQQQFIDLIDTLAASTEFSIPFIETIEKTIDNVKANDIVAQYETATGISPADLQNNGTSNPACMFSVANGDHYFAVAGNDVTTEWRSVKLTNLHPEA